MDEFSQRLLDWFDEFGRHDLPWQINPTPYRVWVSEIMLQQTQVSTVISYFERFMKRFPSIEQLAAATEDEVLHRWSGLGYYSRARNLHRTAKLVTRKFNGRFPGQLEELESLPGIGRSTAGAICSLAMEQPTAILDGNVKRVLVRYHGIRGWPGSSAVNRELWTLANQHTPDIRARDYTQAIMDLGSTVCAPRNAACNSCPLQDRCIANRTDMVSSLPTPKPRKKLPEKSTVMVILQTPTLEFLMQRRPDQGIWAGLWGFPEIDAPDDTQLDALLNHWGYQPEEVCHTMAWAPFRHTFSHFHLDIQVLHVKLNRNPRTISDSPREAWFDLSATPEVGLPRPVQKLIHKLRELP